MFLNWLLYSYFHFNQTFKCFNCIHWSASFNEKSLSLSFPLPVVSLPLPAISLPFPELQNPLIQLQVILNYLLTQIETLNENLVEYLITRDELAIEQDSLLTDIDDITKCIQGHDMSPFWKILGPISKIQPLAEYFKSWQLISNSWLKKSPSAGAKKCVSREWVNFLHIKTQPIGQISLSDIFCFKRIMRLTGMTSCFSFAKAIHLFTDPWANTTNSIQLLR